MPFKSKSKDPYKRLHEQLDYLIHHDPDVRGKCIEITIEAYVHQMDKEGRFVEKQRKQKRGAA